MSRFSVITSKDNSNIKAISLLQKSSKKRREEGVFVLEGLRLCLDALSNGFLPQKVFLTSTFISKNQPIVADFERANEIFELSDTLFEILDLLF